MKWLTVLDLFLISVACDTPHSSIVCTPSYISAIPVLCSCHLCTVLGLQISNQLSKFLGFRALSCLWTCEIQDQQSVYIDAVTLVMLCSDRCALPSSTRAFRCLKSSGRPVKSLRAGGPGRQTACAHLSKYKTAGHNVDSTPERRRHVCAAFPACTGQGVSLLFSASTAYCVPLYAMV